jgi:Tol biopolymer transport system component/C-terminal processing protease CtpA/Prc
MRNILTFFIALLFFSASYAQTSNQWIRYSAISPKGDKIAFAHKGDIYLVDTKGGEAKALTYHQAHDYMPVWDHTGTKLAFASNRYGNFDVFVVDAIGGEAKRLTYHSANESPYCFSADNKTVIFGAQRLDAVNHRQYPTGSQPEVYKVPVVGGTVDQLWTIPAEDIQVRNDGQQMVYHDKKGGENEFRKYHKSAITRDIWSFDKGTGKHAKITSFYGEDRNPVYSKDGKFIFYLSEESGTFNVHKLELENPGENEQITNFSMHPVRYLSMAEDGTLCFTHNGDLYTLTEGGQPQLVNVAVYTGRKHNNEQVISVHGNVKEMAVSPDGKEVAYIVRGEVFVSSVENKMTKRITNTPAQERFVSFSPDGKNIMYASERNGTWSIYQTSKVNGKEPYFFASTVLKETPVLENGKENYQPKYSPDGKSIAFIENRRELKIFTVETKQTKTLLGADKLYYMSDGDQYFEWSPDSKWLFVEYAPVMANGEVMLVAADGSKEMVNLTESGYSDYHPKWVNGGKQMLWFSDRYGLRSYANSGKRQSDVFTLFFTKDTWDKFHLSKDEYALLKELEKKDEGKEDKKDKKKSKKKEEALSDSLEVKIDWEGLAERKERLTIHSSSLGDAVLSKDAETLYYLARFKDGYDLWSTNLRTKETKLLIKLGARSGSLQWDKKMENLFLLAGGKISTIDLKGKESKPVSIKGEMMLDVAAERMNMFDHVWKRTQSMFYESKYHGVDWVAMRDNYRPKVESLGNDFEFSELLSEMLGELNVSHCGARYRGYDPTGDKTASLGIFIDYSYKGEGLKIAEIIKGGPLDKNHIKVGKGMIVKQINGETIESNIDIAFYLNRLADKFTALSIYDPEKKESLTITMKPISLGEERGLLYKRWVKMNEDEVQRLSNGQLAYTHIPGMSDGPYRNTYEKVMGKYYDRKGLIVDTRFNGGGDLVGDLTMFFTGTQFMEYAIEDRTLGIEPGYRWNKPSVAMINEANYSDGHCFSCGYQDLGIGKMIGMPVPGTCSFAGWEMLQNGTVLWGSVPISAKNKAGEWLENNETVPEYQVKNMPGVIDNGRDQQLEKAVEVLLEEVK